MKRFFGLCIFVFLVLICFNFFIGQAQRKSSLIQLQPTPCDPGDECFPPPPPPGIASVTFESVNSPLDCRNTGCTEKRIFPDKNTPSDGVDRKIVRVKVTLSSTPASGQGYKLLFKAFDVDDPSNDSIIDTNGTSGNDNRPVSSSGNPGIMTNSVNQPGTSDSIIMVIPDNTTEVSAYLTVTTQPGNNVVVAASTVTSLSGVTIDGLDLKDASGATLPTADIKRTELLTTWRRLHIEVDSMGNVTGNRVTGVFPANRKITIGTRTLNVTVSPALEPNRFENGRIKIGSNFYPIISSNINANPPIDANTTNTVTIFNNQGTFSITAGDDFTLYDDDDMNNNDGTQLDGDTLPSPGEDVPMPDICLMQGENMPSWSSCTTQGNGDDPATNIFAPAYIRPIYNIGDSNNAVTFVANVSADTGQAIRNLFDFDQIATEANAEFWTAYLLGGYQHVIQEDEDPEPENPTVGITDAQNGVGSVVFLETNGSKECVGDPVFCSIPGTSAHEIGHLFNADEGDGGIMDSMTLDFSPTSIAKIRTVTNP